MKKKISKKAKARKERVKKLQKILQKKISNFAANHITHLFCYPPDVKCVLKKGHIPNNFQQHIYICKHLCQKQCVSFKRKVYL